LIATAPAAQAVVYINGYVYAPQAQIRMGVKNSNGQLFNWGVIVRNLNLSVNGSSPKIPWIQLPKPNTGVGVAVTTSTPPPVTSTTVVQPPPVTSTTYTIRYISVWTCSVTEFTANGGACPHTGLPDVQVRIQWDPASGTAVKVLSWSHVR
jgi:hypothetical protein